MAKELMEIGGFITSGAEIVNHDASLSGNGTVDSPLGLNETVLWKSDNGAAPSDFPIQLSEAAVNFERIRICFRPWTSGRIYIEIPANEDWIILASNWANTGLTTFYNFMSVLQRTDNVTVTFKANRFIQWGTNTITTDTSTFRLFEIVGINRIANN